MHITKTTTLTFTALAIIAGAMVWAVEFFHKSSMLYPRGMYGSRCGPATAGTTWIDYNGNAVDSLTIEQTEESRNNRKPSTTPTYANTGSSGEGCRFTCVEGYAWSGGNQSCVSTAPWGTIAITGTLYVLADRNVGATEVYDGTNCTSSSCPQSVAGYVFQRGNNYGFPAAGSGSSAAHAGITTNSSQIAWTGSHSTWITTNPRYNDGNTIFLRGNFESTQGPCPSGRHVPTTTERQNIFNTLGTSQSDFSITKTLKLPPAGLRDYSDASGIGVGAYGFYRSSNYEPYVDYAYGMSFDSSRVIPQYYTNRSNGFSVRCLQGSL